MVAWGWMEVWLDIAAEMGCDSWFGRRPGHETPVQVPIWQGGCLVLGMRKDVGSVQNLLPLAAVNV